ncbi:MAG TPA: TerC family protein [Cryomorphaceae bacterium]|nr:TerC family protein [Cryomorphaceae bacterium]
MEIFLQADTWIALLTLTFLEIVLGVDNIIFISIVSNKLPQEQQKKARLIGLSLALIMRILLLMGITFIIQAKEPLFSVFEQDFSIRDLILISGGLFLLAKSTTEIYGKVEGEDHQERAVKTRSFASALTQIVLLDIVFSFDSILTAIGLTDEILLMIIAVVVSIIIMMIFAGSISTFINKHPSLQILALSFLILIGFMLAIEGFDQHVPKGYIYFAVFFSLLIEIINMRMRRKENQKRMDVTSEEVKH